MEIERLNKENLRDIIKTTLIYRKVFATEPWFEVSRGPVCNNFYGPENPPGGVCPCKCGKLEDAYPIRETTRYIRDEISKDNAIAFVVRKGSEPIAFGWGYVETGEEFAEKKYKSEETKVAVKEIVGRERVVFYLSEVGVLSEERGQGLGKDITQKVIEEATALDVPFLLRTNKSSHMAKIARKIGMTPIMGSEDTPEDPENNERILFFKQ